MQAEHATLQAKCIDLEKEGDNIEAVKQRYLNAINENQDHLSMVYKERDEAKAKLQALMGDFRALLASKDQLKEALAARDKDVADKN